jgi:biopolymer transport protein TolR
MAHGRDGDEYEITGINVTPLVDIMLVLLIIFLVTATYIVKEAIKIELPRAAAAGAAVPRTLQFLITKDGQVYLGGAPASDAAVIRKVAESRQQKEDLQAVIGADRDARHGAVVAIEVEKDARGAR